MVVTSQGRGADSGCSAARAHPTLSSEPLAVLLHLAVRMIGTNQSLLRWRRPEGLINTVLSWWAIGDVPHSCECGFWSLGRPGLTVGFTHVHTDFILLISNLSPVLSPFMRQIFGHRFSAGRFRGEILAFIHMRPHRKPLMTPAQL